MAQRGKVLQAEYTAKLQSRFKNNVEKLQRRPDVPYRNFMIPRLTGQKNGEGGVRLFDIRSTEVLKDDGETVVEIVPHVLAEFSGENIVDRCFNWPKNTCHTALRGDGIIRKDDDKEYMVLKILKAAVNEPVIEEAPVEEDNASLEVMYKKFTITNTL